MKKYVITLAMALGFARLGYAQTYLSDTVRVNRLTTTYLIFPSKVSVVDISPEYLVKIESGNIVFVRPRLTSARKTPFFVRTENGTYLGYLTLSAKNPPAFVEVSKMIEPRSKPNASGAVIAKTPGPVMAPLAAPAKPSPYNGPLLASLNPFSSVNQPTGERPPVTNEPVKRERNVLEIQMDSMLNSPETHHDREHNSGISVKLTHLVHDSTNTYLQLTLTNKTAMPFLLDQVSFWYQHQAKKRKGAYLDGETYPMEPLYKTVQERVEAGKQVRLRFVLPQFAPQNRSQFVINVREKSGTRNVTMHLPMREVLYARRRQPLLKGKFFETESVLTLLKK